ncbi:mechanosensitive ion channel family protein [Patescibacteria group bacterium]
MDKIKEILVYELGPNTVQDYLIAVGLFIVLYICFKIIRHVILKRIKAVAERTKSNLDDILIKLIEKIPNFIYLIVAIYFPLKFLTTHEGFDRVIDGIFVIAIIYELIQIAQELVEFGINLYMNRHGKNGKQATHTFGGLRLMIKMVLWSVGLLLILSNLGFDISTLIASLGIGGIAIALALQNILSDIFSSFSIYFDKPFEIGDNIIVGEHQGTVKEIGLKTTRLKALKGEELVISNQELTSARIQNFKKIEKRRVVFNIGITYDTESEKLKRVNDIVKKAINSQELADFDRSHFVEFGEYSLNFEIVYFVNSREHPDYVRTQEAINFEIFDAFKKEGIEMAYPSHRVFFENLNIED